MSGRRKSLSLHYLCAALLAAMSFGTAALAQGYPSRPIRLIVPFPASGAVDLIGRSFARRLSEGLGQQVLVDNRGGAGGRIGLEAASRAAPDGYTLVVGTVTSVGMAPVLFPKLPYDPVKSFAPVSLLTASPILVTVIESVPAQTLRELIELAKAKPRSLNFASIGAGSIQHFSGESFKALTGVDLVHVPYQGAAAELLGLLSGQVQVGFDILASFQLQNYQSGKLRALAVASSSRLSQLPNVPTVAEAGLPGFEASAWFGLLAPAGTPPEIVKRLHEEVQKSLASKELRDAILTQGLEPMGNTPEQFAALISEDIARWTRVVKASGFKTE
jgi:tripartite-type tricarboxylate transporter receptor subunit TctC